MEKRDKHAVVHGLDSLIPGYVDGSTPVAVFDKSLAAPAPIREDIQNPSGVDSNIPGYSNTPGSSKKFTQLPETDSSTALGMPDPELSSHYLKGAGTTSPFPKLSTAPKRPEVRTRGNTSRIRGSGESHLS